MAYTSVQHLLATYMKQKSDYLKRNATKVNYLPSFSSPLLYFVSKIIYFGTLITLAASRYEAKQYVGYIIVQIVEGDTEWN